MQGTTETTVHDPEDWKHHERNISTKNRIAVQKGFSELKSQNTLSEQYEFAALAKCEISWAGLDRQEMNITWRLWDAILAAGSKNRRAPQDGMHRRCKLTLAELVAFASTCVHPICQAVTQFDIVMVLWCWFQLGGTATERNIKAELHMCQHHRPALEGHLYSTLPFVSQRRCCKVRSYAKTHVARHLDKAFFTQDTQRASVRRWNAECWIWLWAEGTCRFIFVHLCFWMVIYGNVILCEPVAGNRW